MRAYVLTFIFSVLVVVLVETWEPPKITFKPKIEVATQVETDALDWYTIPDDLPEVPQQPQTIKFESGDLMYHDGTNSVALYIDQAGCGEALVVESGEAIFRGTVKVKKLVYEELQHEYWDE